MPKKKRKEDIQEIRTEQLEIAAGQALTGSAAGLDDVIIQCDKGIVTRTDIDCICNDYLNNTNGYDRIYKSNLLFNGMLLDIYKRVLYRYIKLDNGYNYNFPVIDRIFNDVYIPLCMVYNHTPNILVFLSSLNIPKSYIYNLLNSVSSSVNSVNGYKANINTIEYVKKWNDICESYISDTVLSTNGIGGIFYLKSRYGWTETNNINITANAEQTPKLSIDQLNAIGDQDTLPTTPEENI